MGNEVKVGVVGAGFIAQQSHIPAYLNNPRSKIAGVADPNVRRLDEVKNHFGIKRVFTDYRELFEEKLDAVSICTPTNFHAEIALEAAEKGFCILCEKPIALTLEEADRMIAACERNNVQLMVGFNYRFIRNHQEARKMVREGKIGKPFFVHGQFASTGPYGEYERTKGSFYFDPKRGGGVLFDSGSHLFDLLRWFCGEVSSVSGKVGTYGEGVEVDDVAAVTLEFENGCTGVITCMWTQIESWSAMGSEGFVKIIGTDGKIVSSLFGPSLRYFDRRSKICRVMGEVELTPGGFDPKIPFEALQKSWFDEVKEFVDAVRLSKNVPITAKDGRRVLELVLQAYDSNTHQRPISSTLK